MNNEGPRAIETRYKGYNFRSRAEARFAVLLDHLKMPFEYESQGFETEAGKYLPDFFIRSKNLFIEIKPMVENTEIRLYLAGRMSGWRDYLDCRGHCMVGPGENTKHDYIHGGWGKPQEITNDCLNAITLFTDIYAWIESRDAYATLLEIGFAHANGKRIFVAVSNSIKRRLSREGEHPIAYTFEDHLHHDFWFVDIVSDKFVWADSAQSGFNLLFPIPLEDAKAAALTKEQLGATLIMCKGDAIEGTITTFIDGKVLNRETPINNLHKFLGVGRDEFREAGNAARSARFEFGESGAT